MHLTTLSLQERELEGVTFEVNVTGLGKFEADFEGEHFQADTLLTLRRQLRDAVMASRHEVPFVSESGRRGVIRGYHAGNRDLLVTWDNGDKDRLNPRTLVFRGDVGAAIVSELQALTAQIAVAERRQRTLMKENTHTAASVFAPAFGIDVTNHQAMKEREEALEVGATA